jgi:hypothetical protein
MIPLLLLLFLPPPARAQHILYNEARDKTAKDAMEAVKRITSSPLASSQLANLDKIEKDLLSSETAWTEASMRANLQGLRVWRGIHRIVNRVEQLLALDTTVEEDQRARVLETKREEIQAAIQDLKKQAAPAQAMAPALREEILSRISQADELIELAGKAAKALPGKGNFAAAAQALDQIKTGVDQVSALVASVSEILRTQKLVEADPASLAPSRQGIQIQLLSLEAEYLKTLTALRAMRELDKAGVQALIDSYRSSFNQLKIADQNEFVEDTISKRVTGADTNAKYAVEEVLDVLVMAAAIASYQDASERMWGTREAIEYARFQIRKNAAHNGSYEATLQAATQRLAAYYGSGLKPSQLARLIYELGTAFSLPYLVVTK